MCWFLFGLGFINKTPGVRVFLYWGTLQALPHVRTHLHAADSVALVPYAGESASP
jgi:hypothetical protein